MLVCCTGTNQDTSYETIHTRAHSLTPGPQINHHRGNCVVRKDKLIAQAPSLVLSLHVLFTYWSFFAFPNYQKDFVEHAEDIMSPLAFVCCTLCALLS